MKRLALIIALVSLAACGGGSPGTGPLDQQTAEDLCRTECEHDVECGDALDVDECTDSCVDEVVGIVREDVYTDFSECAAALECTADEQQCIECEPTATHDDYETGCRAALGDCGLEPADLDEICEVTLDADAEVGIFCVFTPAVIDEFDPCWEETDCQTVVDCIVETAEANGIDV